jgi:hypothetical protein
LIAALTDDVGADLAAIGEVETAIGVARGVEYTIENQESLDRDVAYPKIDDSGWGPYEYGQFWHLDAKRGLFMVTAEGAEPGPLLDEAIGAIPLLLETIEFADLDEASDFDS